MADPDAPKGILERNTAAVVAGGETAGYHLNHVTVAIDTSEVGPLDEGLEDLPVSVEGSFETREHPEGAPVGPSRPARYARTPQGAEVLHCPLPA